MNRAKIVSTLDRPSPTLFTSLRRGYRLFKSCSFEPFVSLKGCLSCESSPFLESVIVVDCERFERTSGYDDDFVESVTRGC